MIALIAKGVVYGDIPLTLVMAGVVFALMMELLRLPILPFAIGLYLPLSLSTAMMAGGIVAAYVSRRSPSPEAPARGVLAASGLIAGDACMGVLVALFAVVGWISPTAVGRLPQGVALIVFALLAVGLGWLALRPPRLFREK
jgi:uncharacterized oligopeptide transporter (OPT) family protein